MCANIRYTKIHIRRARAPCQPLPVQQIKNNIFKFVHLKVLNLESLHNGRRWYPKGIRRQRPLRECIPMQTTEVVAITLLSFSAFDNVSQDSLFKIHFYKINLFKVAPHLKMLFSKRYMSQRHFSQRRTKLMWTNLKTETQRYIYKIISKAEWSQRSIYIYIYIYIHMYASQDAS